MSDMFEAQVSAKIYLAKWRSSDFPECQANDITRIREYIRMLIS